MNSANSAWATITIVVASLVFTPIVGGVLGALNQIDLGFRYKAWREVLISLLWFLGYSAYFFFIDQHLTAITLILPPVTLVFSAVTSPRPFFLGLLPCLLSTILVIALWQSESWKSSVSRQVQTKPAWTAYLLGALLTIAVGVALVTTNLIMISTFLV